MSQIIRLHTNNLDCNQNQNNGTSPFDPQWILSNFCSATYSHQKIQHLPPTTLKSDLSQIAPLEQIVRWTTFDTRHQTPNSICMSYPFPRKYQRLPRIYSAMTEKLISRVVISRWSPIWRVGVRATHSLLPKQLNSHMQILWCLLFIEDAWRQSWRHSVKFAPPDIGCG